MFENIEHCGIFYSCMLLYLRKLGKKTTKILLLTIIYVQGDPSSQSSISTKYKRGKERTTLPQKRNQKKKKEVKRYLQSCNRHLNTGCPEKHGNSVTNSISSLL